MRKQQEYKDNNKGGMKQGILCNFNFVWELGIASSPPLGGSSQ